MAWLESAPLWLIGLALLALLLLAHEAGVRLAVLSRKDDKPGDERGYIVSSALALLGLLTAFTFSAAQDRFRLRQDLVVQEANALGTTYLRVQLLNEPYRDAISKKLLQYAAVRLRFAEAATPAEVEANAGQTAVLQTSIWSDLRDGVRTETMTSIATTLINTANETFDLAATRRAAREARVPISVIRVLVVASLTVAALVGQAGSGRRFTVLFVGTMVLVTLAFTLILDLDRPNAGSVRINQAPMRRAYEAIREGEAAKARAPPGPAAMRLEHDPDETIEDA